MLACIANMPEDNIAVPALHKKFLNAVNKSGCWVPLLGWGKHFVWQLCVFIIGKRDTRLHIRSPFINQYAGNAYISVHGYVTYVVPLCIWPDNDIRQLKPVVKNRTTSMDGERTEMEIHMRRLLLACPANVLTLKLIGTYYSPTFHCLLHPALRSSKA